MPWTGSGSYILPPAFSPEVNGTTIDATRYNGLTADVQSGITAALAKNGENTPTANLPMGGLKHTGVGAGTATGQYLSYGQASALLDSLALTNGLTVGTTLAVTGNLSANGALAVAGSLSANGGLAVTGAAAATTFTAALGALATPSYSFSGDLNTGMWSPAADTIAFSTGGAEFLRDSSANTKFTLPSAKRVQFTDGTVIGNAFVAATGAYYGSATNHDLRFRTNDTDKLVVTADGRVLGTALHNNAGSVTGTTTQYIASGTYTPTFTAGTRVASASVYTAQWIRVGNVVTVSSRLIPVVGSAGLAQFSLSLPIATSAALSVEALAGIAGSSAGSTNATLWKISCGGTGNSAFFESTSSGATNPDLAYTFTYLIA